MQIADADEGRAQGLSRDERAELIELRRKTRVQAMEIDILKRASAYFARDTLPLPSSRPRSSCFRGAGLSFSA